MFPPEEATGENIDDLEDKVHFEGAKAWYSLYWNS